MLKKASNALSKLPGVDRLLTSQTGRRLEASFGHAALTRAIRNALDELRAALRQGTDADISASTILTFVERALEKRKRTSIRPVFNLTGTVLHTNLGRAFLPEDAVEAVAHVARGASNLEYEIETGRRGDRDSHVERQICEITGAEAATVVNNNAAAVMLVLNTLALGKEVPVSRGELVEIGGSFRIPDIMERSGCKLIEVGTTNRTHLKDFAAVLGQETAMVMKVHTSNYVIEGFTKAVSEPELARLCRDRDLPFVNDLGSGTLANLEDFGLPHEPTPMDALKNGADVVTFSGDKLLGGPQAGLIVGRSALIKRIKSNPLKRALRCDKMTIAALAAILQLYSDPSRLAERLPVLRALTRESDDIRAASRRVLPAVAARFGTRIVAELVECDSEIGSGALPTRTIASHGIAMRPLATSGTSEGALLGALAAAFRVLPIPVIGRIHEGAFKIDLRCLDDEAAFIAQLDQLEFDA